MMQGMMGGDDGDGFKVLPVGIYGVCFAVECVAKHTHYSRNIPLSPSSKNVRYHLLFVLLSVYFFGFLFAVCCVVFYGLLCFAVC